MRRSACLLALLALCLAPALAPAAEGDYLLKVGKVYRVDGGRERPLEDTEPQRADTGAGPWAWVLVDPGESPEMEGSEGGVWFFRGKEERPAGFLPIEEEAGSCRLTFSPSGDKLLIAWGMEPIKHLSLYFIDKDKGFVKKASFASQGPPFWVDPHRFAFTSVEPGKGARARDRFDLWWSSAKVYDSATGETAAVREASATRNYSVSGYDPEAGALTIWESSVKDEKDWGDDERTEEGEITVPVPAAG